MLKLYTSDHTIQTHFHFRSVEAPVNPATSGLAKVGARAALSFAFAFLKRAWRSGEDSDLCTEVAPGSSGYPTRDASGSDV